MPKHRRTASVLALSRGAETVLVQNCANGPHKLTLKGPAGKLGIVGFRVFAPAEDPRGTN